MAAKRSPDSRRIDQVRRRIDRWRSSRRKQTAMPEDLWSSAVSLARDYGVSMTARTLAVSYASLKDRLTRSKPLSRARDSDAVRFVELDPGSLLESPGLPGAVLELCEADGSKLVVRLREPSGLDLVVLAEAFWRRRS